MVANSAGKALHGREGPLGPDHYYCGYEEWKGRDSYFAFADEEAEYFAGEMRGIDLDGTSILEIGFGSGSFLAWARAAGACIAGTEINEKSFAEAQRFGVEILDAAIETIASQHHERFDIVVAFDVFEHFTLDEIVARMRAIETMLRPGGFLVLRFPNGQSPFGLAPQNAGITHKMALSRRKLEQICQGMSFRAERYAGSFRVRGPMGLKRLARRLRYLARDLLGATLNLIYACDIPWDAVVVLVMRKAGR